LATDFSTTPLYSELRGATDAYQSGRNIDYRGNKGRTFHCFSTYEYAEMHIISDA